MAFSLTKSTQYGINATYYKVIETNINYLNKTAHVTLAGWVDQEARDTNKQPIDSVSVDFTPDNFPFNTTELDPKDINPVKVAYESVIELSVAENVTPEVAAFANAERV